jgi:hypothetical protein
MWGPSADNCVRFSKRPFFPERTHELFVDSAALGFVKYFRKTRGQLAGYAFFQMRHLSIQSKNNSITGRSIPIARVATRHIDNLILKASIGPEVDASERITFYRLLNRDRSFRSSADYILKTFVLAWLSASPASTPIPCTAATANAPTLTIPVCPKDRSIPLANLSSIRESDMNMAQPPPFCLLTVPKTCAPVDAIVCTDEAIITVHVTVSRTRSTGPSDFERIHAQLPVLFGEARHWQWCHVFVAGDEENAKALRYEARKDLPADLNVTIYSAVLDLGRLSSIRKRLDELIEERVSTHPLYATGIYQAIIRMEIQNSLFTKVAPTWTPTWTSLCGLECQIPFVVCTVKEKRSRVCVVEKYIVIVFGTYSSVLLTAKGLY